MRVGNLSQTSLRSRGTFAFQMMRVVIVTAIASTGALALSLAVEDPAPAEETLAVAEQPHDAVSLAETASRPVEAAPVQVATADLLASAPMDGSGYPLAVSENGPDPVAAGQDQDPDRAAAASPGDEAQEPEPSVAGETAPAVDAEMTGAVTVASVPDDPEPAGGLVDLNSASFKELNALRGGGAIGRAIIRHRPYASVEDLVKRRVVRRSVYERIKNQVTAR